MGIGWHLCSSITLIKNGQLVYAASEERFSRKKNDDSFPINAIKDALKQFRIKIKDIDFFAITSKTCPPASELIKSMSGWGVDDYLKQQNDYWYPRLVEKKNRLNELKIMKNSYSLKDKYKKLLLENFGNKELDAKYQKNRKGFFAQVLNVPKNKIYEIDHHTCHAYYSYFSSNFRNEKVLSLTMDGYGDGCNATINYFDSKGNFKNLYKFNNCNVARLYRYITLLLGMKPNEHEYKVMGLAPYGKRKNFINRAYNVFSNTMYVSGIKFDYKILPDDYFFWFKKKLDGIRFDQVAYGLQKYTEDIVTKWFSNCIKKFRISKVVFSGGVSMNVKANGQILKIKNLKKLFVGGTGSDETLSFGAAIYLANKKKIYNKKTNLFNLYLGPKASQDEIKDIKKFTKGKDVKIFNYKDHKKISKLLEKGLIFGRCVGKMEFGARSLGNRSIIADPKVPQITNKINDAIKNRDFWMPFAPAIIDEKSKKYLKQTEKCFSPHMTIAYETHKIAEIDMPACLHPRDKTARAQILRKSENEKFYNLLKDFYRLTKRPSLLNTSFNLHGFPIVKDLKDSFYVFYNSKLDGLITDNFVILKK